MAESSGRVFLVGAGPGDPELITVRGQELLELADVVLHDYLVSPQLLHRCRHSAETICLGQHGRGKLWTQEQINARMIAEARGGRTVVRLKGGDPAIFGRLTEELSALEAAHIPYQVVPGISAATAVSSYAGISLTDRDAASCVTFLTGQECGGKSNEHALDFAAIAKTPGTLVIYMGATTAPKWSQELIHHGKSPETPVAIIRRASLPDQQTWQCTLGEVPQLMAPGEIRPPVLAIVGEVTLRPQSENWFTNRPLFGQTVLVTRPRQQADLLVDYFAELGAKVLVQPAIELTEPRDWTPVDAAIDQLAEFDWLVFSSRNGVEYFLLRLAARGFDARALRNAKLAAIGPATVDALAEHGLFADLSPDEYRAEALADALSPFAAQGSRFLLLRASRGRDVLPEKLAEAGGTVEQVVVYESCDMTSADPEVANLMRAGQIDWTTVTSSAIARSLVRMFGKDLRRTKLVAISPLTAEVLREQRMPAELVAEVYTSEGLVDVLVERLGGM